MQVYLHEVNPFLSS